MELKVIRLDHNIRLIRLIGTLDVSGTGEIESRFATQCAGNNARVIVDLSEADFLASVGIRMLKLIAKSVVRGGGKMVILNPVPDVKRVLEATGIPDIIPVYSYLESAETVLMASK